MLVKDLRPGDMIVSSADNQDPEDEWIEIVISIESSLLYARGNKVKFWRVWSANGDNLVYDGTPFCTWEYDEMSSLACDQTVFRE